MTVRELKNLLERLEKINPEYASARVLFRTPNDMDEEFESGMIDYSLNGAQGESVVILG